MDNVETILTQLQFLTARELRTVVAEAKRLLARKPLYIREFSKPTPNGRYTYLYATWNENGKTYQKSLGRKDVQARAGLADTEQIVENEFAHRGIYALESILFLRGMVAKGFYIAN
ncbi:MAG: hypothetical protein R3C14_23335 [Caldilineaceae bacterium]